jgi:riboflavin transporter FmnP
MRDFYFPLGDFMKTERKRNINIKTVVGMATFAALAYGVTFVFRIPVSFLTFDAKDAVLTVASFIYGPAAAIVMALIPALIELITISGTGLWGFVMNFASSACFAFTASLIYKLKRSFNGAIIGIFASVFATTGLMMLLNILVTPIYMGVSREAVIELMPTLLFPFNLAKSMMNAAITMLIYKPVSVAMKRARLIEGSVDLRFNRQSVIMLCCGGVTLAAAIVIFVILCR